MRGRWAIAPGGRVAHWFTEYAKVGDATFTASECVPRVWSSRIAGRPPGKAARCKKCAKAKGK